MRMRMKINNTAKYLKDRLEQTESESTGTEEKKRQRTMSKQILLIKFKSLLSVCFAKKSDQMILL